MKTSLSFFVLALGLLGSACSDGNQNPGAAGQGAGGAGGAGAGGAGGSTSSTTSSNAGGAGTGGGDNGDVFGPWAGGAAYYAQWSHGPPSDPSFFPITVWLQSPSSAPGFAAIGINTYIGLYQGPTETDLRSEERRVGQRLRSR